MTSRKSSLPRASSLKGVAARQERRIKGWTPEIKKGGAGSTRAHKPGSRNPRKIGR